MSNLQDLMQLVTERRAATTDVYGAWITPLRGKEMHVELRAHSLATARLIVQQMAAQRFGRFTFRVRPI